MTARRIRITEREFQAFVSAYSLYEAEHEADEPGDFNSPAEHREVRENLRALGRVLDRWHEAKGA